MDIAQCYRLLELKSTANLEDVKTSYRRLARQWHPDVNPDNQHAQEMFIQVTQAYKVLLKIVPTPTVPVTTPAQSSRPAVTVSVKTASPPSDPVSTSVRTASSAASPASAAQPETPAPQTAEPPEQPESPPLSETDQKLKREFYQQLQDLIKRQRLPRAIALVEALGDRWPQDLEVRQWRAIIYQCWARQLIKERKLNQARAYLKKALKTDPHNKSLWNEVQQDFKAIEQVF